ncbi:MAG: 30S ribosomal protein S2 [Bacteroidetes bacterium]|nr:30S ribosomal protein S2 [Bacteroidota bacterium]
MARTTFEELLDAGVHFGHLKRKWNPNMAPYIFMERNGIHILDLYKTSAKLEEAASAIKQVARSGKKILFVATKKQAKEIVAEQMKRVNMPYVTERWPGGMLTNFATIRKAVKKMSSIDKMQTQETFKNLSKREKLQITRERAKLERQLGSISDMNRLPSAIFVVDILKEKIAVAEARKLNIPIFAMVDTNSDPTLIDFPIPANDDASKSIHMIVKLMVDAMEEGLTDRKFEKEKKDQEDAEAKVAAAEKLSEEKAAAEYADLEEEEAEKLLKEGETKSAPKDSNEGEIKKREGGKRPRKIINKPQK